MRGIEVRLKGSLDRFELREDDKRKLTERAKQLTGNFVGFKSRMIRLPFKIPFVEYKKAEIDIETTYLNYPHMHVCEEDKIFDLKEKFIGYQLA